MFTQRPDAPATQVAVGAEADQVRSPDLFGLDDEAQPGTDGCAHEQSGAASRHHPGVDGFGFREPRPPQRPLLDLLEYRPDSIDFGSGRPPVFEVERR